MVHTKWILTYTKLRLKCLKKASMIGFLTPDLLQGTTADPAASKGSEAWLSARLVYSCLLFKVGISIQL